MSENEILNELKVALQNNNVIYNRDYHKEIMAAIDGLLDLYNKEKETSHFLQSELDQANAKCIELVTKIDALITDYKEEKEKNKKAIEYMERYESKFDRKAF